MWELILRRILVVIGVLVFMRFTYKYSKSKGINLGYKIKYKMSLLVFVVAVCHIIGYNFFNKIEGPISKLLTDFVSVFPIIYFLVLIDILVKVMVKKTKTFSLTFKYLYTLYDSLIGLCIAGFIFSTELFISAITAIIMINVLIICLIYFINDIKTSKGFEIIKRKVKL